MIFIYINFILGMVAGCVFFLACYKSYNKGLEHGKLLSQAIVPKVDINPIKPIVQAIEQHKEVKAQEEELTDIMGASKESMLESIIKSR